MAIPSGASVPVTEEEVDIGRLNGEDVISLAINLARESAAVKAVASHLGREANKACYMLVTWMSLKEAGEEVKYKGYKAVIPAQMAPSDVMRMEFRPVAVHQVKSGQCGWGKVGRKAGRCLPCALRMFIEERGGASCSEDAPFVCRHQRVRETAWRCSIGKRRAAAERSTSERLCITVRC
ncbi:hypothetical protein Agub_g13860 [Astrephomene gubernaculifera]|uniref:Uncharacterized protein n=1 Tax=Astrephomene gubernaculifera TaxID=47775 RepID=A0AAD3E270_9CHLO|nr:hypothetical protein Agub_g13860 [Astrephomene gubernaculifera]